MSTSPRDAESRCAHSWAGVPAGTRSFAVGLMAGKAVFSPQKAHPLEIPRDLALASRDPSSFHRLFSQALVWGLRRHLGQKMFSRWGDPAAAQHPPKLPFKQPHAHHRDLSPLLCTHHCCFPFCLFPLSRELLSLPGRLLSPTPSSPHATGSHQQHQPRGKRPPRPSPTIIMGGQSRAANPQMGLGWDNMAMMTFFRHPPSSGTLAQIYSPGSTAGTSPSPAVPKPAPTPRVSPWRGLWCVLDPQGRSPPPDK